MRNAKHGFHVNVHGFQIAHGLAVGGRISCASESADRRMEILGWRGRAQARSYRHDRGETRGVKMEIFDCRSEIFRL